MKYFFAITFILFVSAQTLAQAASDERVLYIQKVQKYHRMKGTGQALTVLGSALSIIGFVVMANTTTTTTYNGYGSPQTTTDGNPAAGAAAYLVGSACVGAGVPLWIVGGVNEGRYQRKLDALTVGASITQQGGGITLRYRF